MEKLVVKMIHLISAQLQGRLFPVDTNPGSPRTWQSWKCQQCSPLAASSSICQGQCGQHG